MIVARRTGRQYAISTLLNLFVVLVRRDIVARYRRSALGPLWAVLQPLLYLLVFLFVRGIFKIPSDGLPYPLFTLCGLAPWMFFAAGVSQSAVSILSHADVIKKTSVPRELFPCVSLAVSAVDFLVSMAMVILVALFYGAPITANLFWLIPLIILLVALTGGLGMALAAFATSQRDIVLMIPLLLQVWLIATPVMYPLEMVPADWQALYLLNPIVGIIEGMRSVIARGQAPDLVLLGYTAIETVIVLALAWPVFRAVSRRFADML